MRNQIANLVKSIKPHDRLEKIHKDSSLEWILSGADLFRIQKPDIPNKHLVSYFCVFDMSFKKILLVEHRKAGLWIPSGGHVELDEHPSRTVERECEEELGIKATFLREDPIFITSTVTVGSTAGHTDVSLWYILRGDSSKPLQFDIEEFSSVKWFNFDEIPFQKSDPHMRRFIDKFERMLLELNIKEGENT